MAMTSSDGTDMMVASWSIRHPFYGHDRGATDWAMGSACFQAHTCTHKCKCQSEPKCNRGASHGQWDPIVLHSLVEGDAGSKTTHVGSETSGARLQTQTRKSTKVSQSVVGVYGMEEWEQVAFSNLPGLYLVSDRFVPGSDLNPGEKDDYIRGLGWRRRSAHIYYK